MCPNLTKPAAYIIILIQLTNIENPKNLSAITIADLNYKYDCFSSHQRQNDRLLMSPMQNQLSS